jgi:hypothetical protein
VRRRDRRIVGQGLVSQFAFMSSCGYGNKSKPQNTL